MNEKMKKLLWGVLAVAVVVVCAVSFLTSDLEHIEDTNGPDDYSLTTITEQDILDHSMGCLNFGRTTNALTGTVTFDSGKFTGVKQIMWTNIMFSTGVTLDLIDYEVHSGNFAMAVIHNGEIIRYIQPGETTVDLGAITGDVSLVVAGESADFRFSMFQSEYDSYAHED